MRFIILFVLIVVLLLGLLYAGGSFIVGCYEARSNSVRQSE